jgi:hypothetical protein
VKILIDFDIRVKFSSENNDWLKVTTIFKIRISVDLGLGLNLGLSNRY